MAPGESKCVTWKGIDYLVTQTFAPDILTVWKDGVEDPYTVMVGKKSWCTCLHWIYRCGQVGTKCKHHRIVEEALNA